MEDVAQLRTQRSSSRPRHVLSASVIYGLAIFFGLIALFPFYWAVISSLKTESDLRFFPPALLPNPPQWHNYSDLFALVPFARWILNSVHISVLATLGAVISSTVVAYSFARFRYPGRNLFFTLTIGTLILPSEVTVVPTYLIMRDLKWLDTFNPLIVPSWFGGGAFYIFLLRQFLLTIPRDLDDAAKMDGASSLRILIDILAPICKPAIATVAIISFLGHWDDFFGPLIYLNTPINYPLSLGIRSFSIMQLTDGEPRTRLLMVAATIATLPPLAIFLAAQRSFVQGFVMSGIKG